MSNDHKPLSAAEIEDLRELEAKATPGVWYLHNNGAADMVASTGSNWPVALKPGDNDGHLICAMRNALPRLLSMLQPPTDAAVREAVAYLNDFRHSLLTTVGPEFTARIDTLLSCVRAVQSPGLTEAQVEAVKKMLSMLETPFECDCGRRHGHFGTRKFRVAFPGVFGKEG